jgi:hypothetical protein
VVVVTLFGCQGNKMPKETFWPCKDEVGNLRFHITTTVWWLQTT